MTPFSDLIREHIPDGWSNRRVAAEAHRLKVKLSRATVDTYTRDDHGRPTPEIIQAFHDVLRIPLPRLRSAADVQVGEATPWRPPHEADQLTRRQRAAITELIRSIVDTSTTPLNAPDHGARTATGGSDDDDDWTVEGLAP